jgi:ribonuclease R
MKVKEMAKRLEIPSDEYRSFRDRVRELMKEGFLIKVRKGKYALHGETELYEGRIEVRKDSKAHVRPDGEGEEKIFISLPDRKGAVNGDRVRVLIVGESRKWGTRRGRVVEIVHRAHPIIAGRLARDRGKYVVKPGNPRIDREVVIEGEVKGVEEGELVTVNVREWGKRGRYVYGTIDRVYKDASDTDVDIISIILEFGLPLEFPADVLEEAEQISTTIGPEEISDREDCRSLFTFTVDPADAHDFDDALSIEELSGGLWRVGIHIADVSHYVKIDSALDGEAMKRGNSVYLVDRAIPMLPETLSGDTCSLKPDEDRLTMSVFVVLDNEGRIDSKEIKKSVIRSRSRLTYDQAQSIIDGETNGGDDRLSVDVKNLFRLSKLLRGRRMERGSLDFDRPESFVVLNENGLPVDIRKVTQLGSHRLVEEFMVLANEVVAAMLDKAEVQTIFRIHEAPSETDIEDLERFLLRFGYSPTWRNKGIVPEAFQKILHSVRGKREEGIIMNLTLRSMKRAIYSVENVGHFGLATDLYTHFTSPIRRFPDLTVHRQLKALLHSVELPYPGGGKNRLDIIAGITTETERVADLAEWDSVDLKKVQFMERHLGEIFDGTICGFLPFGFFVLLDAYFVEGMVALRDLEDDYYDFHEDIFAIVGRRKGLTFSLGDRVKVQVARTSREKREIDFFLTGHESWKP